MGFICLLSQKSIKSENFLSRNVFYSKCSVKVSRFFLLRPAFLHRRTWRFLENLVGRSFGANRVPQWEHFDKLYLLRPSTVFSRTPLGVIHFVGGAFVGSSSQLAYRSLLEGLVQLGYLVIVTPYDTSFDHLVAAESVNSSFVRVMRQLQEEYGIALPVVGLSHSLGCIIQILSSCLFPHVDVNTKGHIFMAYNNKPLKKAVPLYKELLIPSIQMFSSWSIPKEEMNSTWKRISSLFEGFIVSTGDSIMENIDSKTLKEQVYFNWQQIQRAWKQLDPLLEQIQSGRDEFHPSPSDIENIIIQKYSHSSIIIRCEDDLIDESLQLYRLLRGRDLYIKLRSVPGTHLTPLEQNTQVVDNFLRTHFQISSSFSQMSNLYRLIEVIGDSLAEIIFKQASTRII
ncbi:hypothetical protein Gasu2_59110 [Galdieria sulphuraria]|uniref:Hydrolase n=1 Tax=Galdieria sulphuraria TaxID=130081 RepID=M2WVH5_GALSU|nr:hydrolase [Galdieria sulphuraria]EME27985.1 hydrolase [Galdieria sulphuraria]GJD11785.1 hypothetical protein Gasu2_59110 [Galdieria sulphuraria]|eukprot:XP_005704505.1 hydrolase [Galdieria sulphuraria]